MIKKNEFVSIVLPTYNRADTVGKAIESVLGQTYPYFELLVIDDGSTDNTEAVVKAYQDERIRYCKMPQNGGQSKARNYGMQLAKYDYIAFEDSDDIWYANKLEMQMQIMKQADSKIGVVYHKLKYCLQNGNIVMPDEGISLEKKNGDIYAQLLYDNLIGMPTILIRKECLEEIGYLDESLRSLEDYDFVLRICQKYQAVFIDQILLDAEYSENGVSANSYNYLVASCVLVCKYKYDYIRTNTFNHRLEVILRDAEIMGIKNEIVQFLEKLLSL